MRQGVLQYRNTDLFDGSETPRDVMHNKLPLGCDVASMVPLYEQGVVCVCGSDLQSVCLLSDSDASDDLSC
mgnify:CR=1 FL=1